MNNYLKNVETMTELPPTETFSDNATLDRIHDAYIEDFKKTESKQKTSKKGKLLKKIKAKLKNSQSFDHDDLTKLSISASFIERIVCQNVNEDVIDDFKYWEDKADEFRTDGSLLPLWKFNYEGTKKFVTAMCWLPSYPDGFVSGYASFSALEPEGFIVCYSLKNPAYPFRIFKTDFGCMSLDVHPELSYYIAAGFFDGSIGIYSLVSNKSNKSGVIVLSKNGNHRDPVWQVQWDKRDVYGFLTLCSISSDGRVIRWTIKKNDLYPNDVINLKNLNVPSNDFLGNLIQGSGTCFEFNKQNDILYLIGTEEGKVHLCSKGYYNSVMETYVAHTMSVYAVRWNPFYSKYFLSCSADWTVNLWEIGYRHPLETFDLGSPVPDCAWAPYSSSVFAAITADGRVCVFDLNVIRLHPICQQTVINTRKRKLTRIAFNNVHPIIIVGDDRGNIKCFKLSPNLRKKPKEIIKKDLIIFEGEVSKLERIFASYIDPDMVLKKTFKMYEIPRPKEIQQKRIESLTQQEQEKKESKKSSDKNKENNDEDDNSEKEAEKSEN